MKGNSMEEGTPESDGELQQAFGNMLGFPTHGRPAESLWTWEMTSSEEEIMEWFNQVEGKKIQGR